MVIFWVASILLIISWRFICDSRFRGFSYAKVISDMFSAAFLQYYIITKQDYLLTLYIVQVNYEREQAYIISMI